jgi:hypothetical protein
MSANGAFDVVSKLPPLERILLAKGGADNTAKNYLLRVNFRVERGAKLWWVSGVAIGKHWVLWQICPVIFGCNAEFNKGSV